MTSGPHELKAALQRLIDGNASDADRDALRTALNTDVLVTGVRAGCYWWQRVRRDHHYRRSILRVL